METTLIWFRQDLRLEDNPVWARALASGRAIIPVYILADKEAGAWRIGGAGRWWLHHALADLDSQLAGHGLRLILRSGDSVAEISRLMGETGATAVYWNRCYEPWRLRIDSQLQDTLQDDGIEVFIGNSALLREPWTVATQAGQPYRVFTPYSRACAQIPELRPVTMPDVQPVSPHRWPPSLRLEELGLLPRIRWDRGMAQFWEPSRAGGFKRLRAFLKDRSQDYAEDRDIPFEDGTSRLSPYLHWGQIGAREVAAAVRRAGSGRGLDVYHRELLWREFAYHVLYHFPDTPQKPLQMRFEAFPWRHDERLLEAWQRGQTGYPMVDAGMRQLWQTGWMHNRVRMIVASFLVKHLLHSWEDGARWFWDTLVDADLASNTLGWQWAGGCGADAAPYFRIFNPITQGQKFDPAGHYIRRHVPELANFSDTDIHTPWETPPLIQGAVGCRVGDDYPEPVVEHAQARARALEAFAEIKG